jgi:3-phytase
MMNHIFSRALACLLLSGAAAAQASALQAFPSGAEYHGAYVQPLVKEDTTLAHWVIAGTRQGLQLLDAEGKVHGRAEVRAELLDLRQGIRVAGSNTTLVATVVQPGHFPTLLSLSDSGTFTEVKRLPATGFLVENLCLQRDFDNNVYLYLLDERGIAEHWLVLDNKGNPHARLVRRLSIAPNSTSCSVDDDQGILYIAEEDVGIWAYNASPEAKPGRRLIDITGPFGKLAGGSEAVTAIPGGVVAISMDDITLQAYSVVGKKVTLEKSVKLSSIKEPELISRYRWVDDKTLEFVVFDDDDGSQHLVRIPWTVPELPKGKVSSKVVEVQAVVQTEPVARFGDAADDPAIWVNSRNPQRSRVLGTDKKDGLYVYDMQGRQVQFIPSGKVNNVDLRYGLRMGRTTVDLAAASDRDDNSLALYTINQKTGVLTEAGNVPTTMSEIYGLCMYQSPENQIYVFANDKGGEFQQYLITVENGKLGGRLVRSFHVETQPEGCVADDQKRKLYVGEERVAVWTIGADPDSGTELELVARPGGLIVADIEGLAIYKGKKKDYLIVSSQGNDTYVVLEADAPYREIGAFRIGANPALGIDGTSETDGLEVTNRNLGGVFSVGILVVQDGHNVMPEAPQNFKYVPWSSIREALNLE